MNKAHCLVVVSIYNEIALIILENEFLLAVNTLHIKLSLKFQGEIFFLPVFS